MYHDAAFRLYSSALGDHSVEPVGEIKCVSQIEIVVVAGAKHVSELKS